MVADSGRKTWLTPVQALARQPLGGLPQSERPAAGNWRTRYGYRIGDLALLINDGTTAEALEVPVIYPVPNTASWFPGLINLRGNLVPVFDLRSLLGQAANVSPRHSRVLVIDRGERAVGLRIDSLPQARVFGAPVEPTPPVPEVLQAHLRAVYADDTDLWIDYDLDGLLRRLRARIPL